MRMGFEGIKPNTKDLNVLLHMLNVIVIPAKVELDFLDFFVRIFCSRASKSLVWGYLIGIFCITF